jgi:hypothetical protein
MQRSGRRIEVANGVQADVEAVGDISLELADGFMILLRDVLFVPLLHRRSERRIEVANGVQADVKAVGEISLELADGFTILLRDVLFVPLLHRNLISVSHLDKDSYECYFAHGKCAIWFKDAYVGIALLHDELYLLSLRKKCILCVM